jgi:hypothetical protein
MSTKAELMPWWMADLGGHFHLVSVDIYTNTDPTCQEDWSCCEFPHTYKFKW